MNIWSIILFVEYECRMNEAGGESKIMDISVVVSSLEHAFGNSDSSALFTIIVLITKWMTIIRNYVSFTEEWRVSN